MDVITQSSPCLSSDIKPRKIALVDVIMQAWPCLSNMTTTHDCMN
jgi:hypothetical protein